ncbi:MAG: Co2+/Mg2+ efflux protein ApaG [Bdellovibrionota bacterium]
MSTQKSLATEFEIVAKPTYVAAESKPDQQYHFFAYKMIIKNTGSVAAQLVSRHWIITDALGQVEEVRGPGVVGLQPKIQPGQTFEYESACPLTTSFGTMKGTYNMVSDEGENFVVDIPEFYLIAPQALH